MKSIDLLRLQFPNKILIALPELAMVTGFAINTIRNRIRARTWPIPAQRESARGRIYFDLRDVAQYLDDRAANAIRRRGRPTKAEQAAAQASAEREMKMGWSVGFAERQGNGWGVSSLAGGRAGVALGIADIWQRARLKNNGAVAADARAAWRAELQMMTQAQRSLISAQRKQREAQAELDGMGLEDFMSERETAALWRLNKWEKLARSRAAREGAK